MLFDIKKTSFLLLFVVLIFLSICCYNFLQFQQTVLFGNLHGDEITHFRWMQAVLAKDWNSIIPFFRSPLYGFYLAFVYSIGQCDLHFIYFSQIVLNTGTIILIFLMSIRLFSKSTALIASLSLSFYPVFIYFGNQLLITSLFTFLATASLFFLSFDDKRKKFYVLGACFAGLATLTRPNILVFILMLVFYKLLVQKKILSVFRLLFFYSLIIISPFLIATFQNSDSTLMPTQGGINFYAGNNLNADGLIPAVPNFAVSDVQYYKAKQKLPKKVWSIDNMWIMSHIIPNLNSTEKQLTSSKISKWWYKQTFLEIKKDYLLFLKRVVKKICFLIAYYETPNNSDFEYAVNNFFPLLSSLYKGINFSVLWALAVPGLFFAWRNNPCKISVLLIYLFSMSLVLVLFFVNSRFRIPLIPVLTIFMAETVKQVFIYLKNSCYKKLLLTVFIISISYFSSYLYLIYPETYFLRASKALYHNSLAKLHIKYNDKKSALKEIDLAIKFNTEEKFSFLLTKAKILFLFDYNLGKSISLLEQSVSLKEHPVNLYYLAFLYYKKHQKEKSLHILEKLFKIQSDHKNGLLLLKQIKDGE